MALETLSRVWEFPSLPGYREPEGPHSTYYAGDYRGLPPIGCELDEGFCWLRAQPTVLGSLVDAATPPAPARSASADQLDELIGDSGAVPPRSFATFVADQDLRARIRSCTACYLDLEEVVVPVDDGGWLIHFLSDQQWVLHWLLYVAPHKAEAVIVTDVPFGFRDDEAPARFDPTSGNAAVCAESFSEFVYRFWIENEIWYRATDPDDEPPLSDEQRAYAEHYRA